MARNTFRWGLVLCAAICATTIGVELSNAQSPQSNNGGPQDGSQGGPQNGPPQTYQRQAFDGWRHGRDRRRDDFRQQFPFMMPQVNSGWYQRPYPTHLDYFRLRSNETPPPYYGNWNGSYGGWAAPVGGWEDSGNGYLVQPNDGGINNQGVSPRDLLRNPPSEQSKSGEAKSKPAPDGNSESLPAPSK